MPCWPTPIGNSESGYWPHPIENFHLVIPGTAKIKHFSSPMNCRDFMIAVRWDDGIVRCPHCGSDKVTFMAKANLHNCNTKHPKQKFSLNVGTIFEDSVVAAGDTSAL
jgi:hypothetical protein